MLRTTCAIVCLVSLTACGLRGPLYLPPHRDAPRPVEQQPAKAHPEHDSPVVVTPLPASTGQEASGTAGDEKNATGEDYIGGELQNTRAGTAPGL